MALPSSSGSSSPSSPSWRDLHSGRDIERIRLLMTCLAAMEFDARVVAVGAGEIDPGLAAFESPDCPMLSVEVREEDWPALVDVRDELFAEQEEFDARHAERRSRGVRVARRLIAIAVVIAAVAAGLRLMDVI